MKPLRRILALMVKEFALILKDPKSRLIVIGPPLVQFFVFGYAATYDLNHVRYAVLDESRGTLSRHFLAQHTGKLFSAEGFCRLEGSTAQKSVKIVAPFTQIIHGLFKGLCIPEL